MLTQEQIQYLHQFCTKHYVRFYDLQLELVDHLANAIEQKMDENLKLNFEQALDKVYKGFDVFGFANVVKEKSAAIEKSFMKEYWKIFTSYFTPPKLVITATAFSIVTFFSLLFYSDALLLIYAVAFSIFGYWSGYYWKKRYPHPVKPLLSYRADRSFFSLQLSWLLPWIYASVKHRFGWVIINERFEIAFFVLFFTLIIVFILADFEAYKKMYDKTRREFPMAFQNK
ncbi:MAG TPA: hypothetical protein PK110_09975 [Niabella sp.]|nr:hypothetical protein [Niabella sp.]HRO85137.1 hypothetical protein [Niabella sp.]HUN01573.1 hypothetical protein [Niabella sp.]